MEKETMKTASKAKLEKPVFYAQNAGEGSFAAATYIFTCSKCGLCIEKSIPFPPGACGCAAGGLHSWTKTTV